MEIRSFLAFELPPAMKGVLAKASQELRKTALDLRWVRVDNIHLTVVFMGTLLGATAVDVQYTHKLRVMNLGQGVAVIVAQFAGSNYTYFNASHCFPLKAGRKSITSSPGS